MLFSLHINRTNRSPVFEAETPTELACQAQVVWKQFSPNVQRHLFEGGTLELMLWLEEDGFRHVASLPGRVEDMVRCLWQNAESYLGLAGQLCSEVGAS